MFHLLPYLDQGSIYATSGVPSASGTLYDQNSPGVFNFVVRLYLCPGDPSVKGDVKSTLPDRLGWALTSYSWNFQVFGLVNPDATVQSTSLSAYAGEPRIPTTFADGTSKTIIFSEKLGHCNDRNNLWANNDTNCWQAFAVSQYADRPGKIGPASKFKVSPLPFNTPACDPTIATTAHLSGIHALLADGSARSLKQGVSAETWWAACTPSGNDLLGDDW
jgi:hypothetical protein